MAEPNRYVVEAYRHSTELPEVAPGIVARRGAYLGRFLHYVWAYSAQDAIVQTQLQRISDKEVRSVYSVRPYRSWKSVGQSPPVDEWQDDVAPLFLGKDR